MTARGAGILGSITFILLLAFGSYLLDVPAPTVMVGSTFAILVVLWVGTREAAGSARSFTADAPDHSSAAGSSGRAAVQGATHGTAGGTTPSGATEAEPGVGKASGAPPVREPLDGSRGS